MGQIQRLTRGQVKPYNSVPRIDWSHPLAAGLATYCYDAGGVIIDLVNSGKITIGGNGTAPFGSRITQFGRGLQFPLDGWGSMPPFPSGIIAPFGGTAPFSAAMATMFVGNTGPSSPDSACVTVQDAGNSQNTFFGFNTAVPDKVSAVYGNVAAQNFTGTVINNTFQSWATVSNAAGTAAQQYANGLADILFSGTTTFNGNTQAQVMYNTASINAGQTFGNGINGFVFYFAMWGRALTAQEVLLLHQDPYCFLIYPEDEMFASLIGVQAAAAIIGGGAVSLQLFAPMTGPLRLTPSGLLVPSLAFPPSVSAAPVVTTPPSSTLPMMGVG